MEEQHSITSNQIKCQYSQKRALLICCSSKCTKTYPFACNDFSCQCQLSNHFSCKFIRYDKIFSSIKSQIKTNQPWMKQLVKKTNHIYDQIIEKISIEKQNLIFKYQHFGISDYASQVLKKIQENRQYQLTGQQISNLLNQQERKQSKIEKQINHILIQEEEYSRLYKKKLKECQKFLEHLNKSLFRLCLQRPQIQSKIIQQKDQGDALNSFFEDKKVKQYKLLYRATQNAFSTSVFHTKCENIRNNLVLVKTRADRILGGFSSQAWDNRGVWKNEGLNDTFLFSITNNQKYKCKNANNVIGTNPTNGPLFGYSNGHYDIYIQDRADINQTSNFGIGGSYGNQRVSGAIQSHWSDFSGATNGDRITLKEWQVYEVLFQ